MTSFERLHPAGPPLTAAELVDELRPWDRAHAERPYVTANMIATADGRAAEDGSTRTLGGEADIELLVELRAAADAVLIGPGTIRAEGYDRLVKREERRERRRARGLEAEPLAVVISRSFDLPWDAGLFQAPEQPILVYTAEGAPDPPPTPAPVEVARLADPTPQHALADLRRRGVRALHTEGGPMLLRGLLADGVVDELFLTIAAVITGDEDEPQIVRGGRLPERRTLRLETVLRFGDEIFLRYAVAG